jgi:hypothetical protein
MSEGKVRHGHFFLDQELIDQHPDFILELLHKLEFLPMRVQMQYDRFGFEYYGSSPWFEECDRGCVTPEYIITVSNEVVDGELSPKTFKVKKYEVARKN